MEIALWIVTGLLALVFLTSGLTKTFQSRARLRDSGMTYVEDFPAVGLKAIGLLEILGGLGLLLPPIFDSRTEIVPAAAVGLALLMAGAVVVHVRRREPFVIPLLLAVLALLLAVLRLDAYAL